MRFTWCQKSPIIQRRLDFWLISDALQEDVEAADIITSPKSDHSAITLSFNGVDDSKRGPSFWKFNSTLVNDKEYCNLLDTNLKNWLEEFKEVVDKRLMQKLSYISLFEILKSFEELSGLKVNHEKTELLALGNNTLRDVDFPKHTVCEVVKILGVYFGYDVRQRDSLNFKQTLKAVKKNRLICGNGEAFHCLEEFKSSKRLLFPNLCTEHLC